MEFSVRNPLIIAAVSSAVLVGLVGKNAILLVDYTDTLRKRGMPSRHACGQF